MKLLLITGPPLLNLRVVSLVGDERFLCSDLDDISCSSFSRSHVLQGKTWSRSSRVIFTSIWLCVCQSRQRDDSAFRN